MFFFFFFKEQLCVTISRSLAFIQLYLGIHSEVFPRGRRDYPQTHRKGYDTTIFRMTENKQISELGRLEYNCQSATFTNCIESVCFFVSVAKNVFFKLIYFTFWSEFCKNVYNGYGTS